LAFFLAAVRKDRPVTESPPLVAENEADVPVTDVPVTSVSM
jgi:hypothetical protein